MSIGRLFQFAAQRQAEAGQVNAEAAAAAAAPAKPTIDSAMEKITAFIPSEIIGIYIAGFGILAPVTTEGKWWIFGICVALIPLFMLLNYLRNRKRQLPVPGRGRSLVLVVCALVAFTAWASAMPNTPFLAITPLATQIGGFAVLVVAGILYAVADLLDIFPKTP
jgi:hypothetical protein